MRTGTQPVNEGPPGQGEEPPHRHGANPRGESDGNRPTWAGARGSLAPRLNPHPQFPAILGGGEHGRGEAGPGPPRWYRGPLSDKTATKIQKGPSPDCAPLSERSCLRIRNPAPARGPPGGLPPAARARPHFLSRARRASLLLRPPPEAWGAHPAARGCRGALTLSGGGNCS